jgi:hypothetical protein
MRLPLFSWTNLLRKLGFSRRLLSRRPRTITTAQLRREARVRLGFEELESRCLMDASMYISDATSYVESGNLMFNVGLTGMHGNVSVDYNTSNGSATAGSDYTATSGTLHFASWDLGKTISVPILSDTLDENNETFTVTLSNLNGATFSDSQAVGTINDDDVPPSVGFDPSSVNVSESAGIATFTVKLTGSTTENTVTVQYATGTNGSATAGSDFTAASGTLTFVGGDREETFTVPIINDTAYEFSLESFPLTLSNPTNAMLWTSSATGYITENDSQPTISINDVSVNESAGTAQFTVSLSNQNLVSSVTVWYATANDTATAGSDYTAISSTQLTFATGETQKTVNVSISNDTTDEVNETFFVNLSMPSGATIGDSQGIGTIIDNDGPTISINDVTVDEDENTATFTVTLSAASPQTVTVNYATANNTATAGNDYEAGAGTVTFQPNDTSETVTIDITDDSLDESDETFNVNLTSATNATIYDDHGLGAILDDDPPPEIDVQDEYLTSVDDRTIDLGYARIDTPVQYTFTIENQAASDLVLDPESLTLPAGFSLVGDFPSSVAPNGTATFVLRLDAAAPGVFSGDVSFGTNDPDEDPYVFAITGEVWNNAPVAIDDIYGTVQGTELEVSAAGVLENDGDAEGQSLTATLVAGPAHALTFDLNTDGSFTYEPEAQWVGIDTFTYEVSDGHDTSASPATVRIGVANQSGPEIEVFMVEYEPVPDGTGEVDFGETTEGDPRNIMFMVMNVGTENLTLDPASFTVPDGYSVALEPEAVVAPGSFTVFTVQMDADEVGTYEGEVSFDNNDSDENPYNFATTGEVTAGEPEIEVYDEASELVEDDTGSVDLGQTTEGEPVEYTFTITNVGEDDLTLDPESLELPEGFSLVSAFDATVDPSDSTEFTVQLDATAAGNYSGEVSFTNNDGDEDPYNFTISGYVSEAPALSLDLDADDSSGAEGVNYYTEWTVGSGLISIEDVLDATIEADSPTLESLTVTISDLADAGDELLDANVSGTSISKSYDAQTGVLSLTGQASVGVYQQVLRTITYDNTAEEPTGYERAMEFDVYDGTNHAGALTSLLLFYPEEEGDVTAVAFIPADEAYRVGIKDADEYGLLSTHTNPDGDVNYDRVINASDMSREALIEPRFKGGDQFFPDADIKSANKPRNIVRVRAYLTDMAVDDLVAFKVFDVDDPSTDKRIDANGDAGGDNRGTAGKLRTVNAGNVVGAWSAGIVTAKVKELLDANGQPEGVLVAEVDLMTSLSPGDNYRVYAVPNKSLRARLVAAHVRATGDGRVQTNDQTEADPTTEFRWDDDDPHLTRQLSVWRYLHVEDDSSVNVYGLMQAVTGSINRQDNRFADAYLEPEYATLNAPAVNTSRPATGRPLAVDLRTGQTSRNDTNEILGHMQSPEARLEQDAFWVVYVTNGFTQPTPGVLGVTMNIASAPIPFEASVVFTDAVSGTMAQRVAVHEVGHQLLMPGGAGADKDGHRGDQVKLVGGTLRGKLVDYYLATDAVKREDKWLDSINIMTSDAQKVPLDNSEETIPGLVGGKAGPIDRFFFHPNDVAAIRRLVKSPGKGAK